jgi:hypothetical protein
MGEINGKSGGEGEINLRRLNFCQQHWQFSAVTINATSHLRPMRICILSISLENQIGRILVAMVVTAFPHVAVNRTSALKRPGKLRSE